MLKIYLARHGQNEDNVNGILNGHRDEPLTPLGLDQAKQTAQFIKDNNLTFDRIYSSPLKRAYVTAEIISHELELTKPVVLDSLIERDFGVMSGKLAAQIIELCSPEVIQTDTITYFLSPEGAETFPDLIERGKKVINFVRNNHSDGSILLLTHGDIGKMIYAAYYNLDWKEVLMQFHFGNCELLLLTEDSPATEAHVFKQNQHNH
ncbi:MAG: hypothetical protein RLZZ70_123 [Candidatus Parcubacteria bacterium]|jgi:probable phosphoglycerate mutase